tara:strand:+ start:183 stop:401 length:219 start_codon:yes stop_codon:yes gene_type:complete
LKFGVLVVMVTVLVHVTDAKTGSVQVVDSITQKLLELKVVVNIVYVLVEFIVVVRENVLDVMDVHPTLMVTT